MNQELEFDQQSKLLYAIIAAGKSADFTDKALYNLFTEVAVNAGHPSEVRERPDGSANRLTILRAPHGKSFPRTNPNFFLPHSKSSFLPSRVEKVDTM